MKKEKTQWRELSWVYRKNPYLIKMSQNCKVSQSNGEDIKCPTALFTNLYTYSPCFFLYDIITIHKSTAFCRLKFLLYSLNVSNLHKSKIYSIISSKFSLIIQTLFLENQWIDQCANSTTWPLCISNHVIHFGTEWVIAIMAYLNSRNEG